MSYTLTDIAHRAIVVEKLCEYLQYKQTYETAPAKEDIPEFTERIPPEVALELYVSPPASSLPVYSLLRRLVAADYYESKLLKYALKTRSNYCIC